MQVYTVKEVAELLSCSDGTVRRLIKDGQLIAVNLSSRYSRHANYRVTQQQLDAFLNSTPEPRKVDEAFRSFGRGYMGL